MSDSEILTQLERLAKACPEDRCDLWVTRLPDKSLSFTAYLAARDKLPGVFGHGNSPESAVTNILPNVVGKRGNLENIANKQAEIAKLKNEIAKLESEIEPLLGAIAGAKQVQP